MEHLSQLIFYIPGLLNRLKPLDFLFSKGWGIVWNMPLVFLGIIGFFAFTSLEMRKRWPYLLAFMISSLIPLGMDYGSCYGYRYFIGGLPFCFIGVAFIFEKFLEKGKGLICVILVCIAAIWQYLSLIHYRIIIDSQNPNYIFDLAPAFLKVVRENVLSDIILPPLSWFSMVFRWGFKINSLGDAFMLIGAPVLFILFLFIPLFIWYFKIPPNSFFTSSRNKLILAFLPLGFIMATDAALLLQNPPKTKEAIAFNHRIVGERLIRRNEFEDAYSHLSKSRKLNMEDIETPRLLAYTFLQLNQPTDSLLLLKQIIERGKGNFMDYWLAALVKSRLGEDHQDIIPYLKRAAQLVRNDAELTQKLISSIKDMGFQPGSASYNEIISSDK